MSREPRIGELFAGYGGLGLGTQAVYGGEVVWVSEFDEGPSRILAERLPHAPNLGDITKIDWSRAPRVDVLTGGFPCQDVSAAGRRLGMTEGTRSGLWYEMVRAIDALRPPLVIIENVRGLFSAKAYSYVGPDGKSVDVRALDAVLGTLCDLGYDAQWTTLRASEVGAPHRRDRVFITAHTDRVGSSGWDGEPLVLRPEGDHAPDLGAAHRPATSGRAPGVKLSPGGLAQYGHLEPFGPYAPALARWERITGRLAPEATEPGRGGRPRLTAPFVEWLMGLPEGWVTEVPGLDRRAQLKALGNGVVPQQASHAIRHLANIALL